MRVDTNTKGHRQWFYFSIKNSTKQKIKINIFRFKKKYSLYQRGMRPYVRSRKSGQDWMPGGQNVKYCIQKTSKLQQNNVTEDRKETYYLSFTYKFQYQNDEVYFAACIPYTYTFLENQLNSFQNAFISNYKNQSIKFQIKKLTNSSCGVSVPLITISKKILQQNNQSFENQKCSHQNLTETNTSKREDLTLRLQLPQGKKKQINVTKKIIIINARSHSGQSSSSWVLDGFLQYLTKSTQIADWVIKHNICFKIIPMLNVDGVFMGNYRTGIVGDDFNRKFLSGKKQYFPEIHALKKLISQSKRQGNIQLFLDLHGHSVLKNSFIYGPTDQMFKKSLLKNLPHKLWHNSEYFKLSNCKFKMQKDLIQTARVFFQIKQQILCFTCQNSLGLYYNQKKNFQYLKDDYKKFGATILKTFQQLITQKNKTAIKNVEILLTKQTITTSQEKFNIKKSINSSLIKKNNIQSKQSKSPNKQFEKLVQKMQKKSEKGTRQKLQTKQKRNSTQGEQTKIKQLKQIITIQSPTQKKKYKLQKLPSLSLEHIEKQKTYQKAYKNTIKNILEQKFIKQSANQTKKKQIFSHQKNIKRESQKIKLFHNQKMPTRQLSNTNISSIKMNYKKRKDVFNLLPQQVKNKINLKPFNNDLSVSTKMFEEQMNFQDYSRSRTYDQSYLQKKIKQHQLQQLQNDFSNQGLEQIYQNFSQNYESIDDIDSQSEDLDTNEKKYILDHIKVSRLNRKKSEQQQSQSQIQQKEQNKQQQEDFKRESSILIRNVNKFKQIKFKSVQSVHKNSAINKSTFSINKNNLKRQKQQTNKFKEQTSKRFKKGSIVQQDAQQQFVSITHKKRLNQRPGIKNSLRQPYILIKLKSSLPNKNRFNIDRNYNE